MRTEFRVYDRIKEQWVVLGGGGANIDIQADGVSIVENGVANLKFGTTYDSELNKIATMADLTASVEEAIEGEY